MPRLAVALLIACATCACADPVQSSLSGRLAQAEALLATPPAALAMLEALPLSERQSQDYHWMLARAAHAADRPALAAEAAATATLLLPGAPRDFAPVRQWLATRARQAQARALAQASTHPALAAAAYLDAVKADGAVLADDDRGLRAGSLGLLREQRVHAPADPALAFELGWHLYFQGESAAARRAFAEAVPLEPDPYRKWRDQLWVDRLDREAAAARADDAASDQRRAAEQAADDKRHAAEDAARAARARKTSEADAQAAKQAARERRHQITLELIDADARIRTLRERRMIRLTPATGLTAQSIYEYLSELKSAEDAEQARKRQLIEERDALP